MTPIREFYGGPMDGEVKEVEEGQNAIKVHLRSNPQVVGPPPVEGPDLIPERFGTYLLCRRRDRLDHFVWQGEQSNE